MFSCDVVDFILFDLCSDDFKVNFLVDLSVKVVGLDNFEFEFDFFVVLGDGGCRLFKWIFSCIGFGMGILCVLY